MNRVFSNGPLADFVFNPFTDIVCQAKQLCVAAPFVTETSDLLSAVKSGKSVLLLVGLNTSTSPQALEAVHGVPNFSIRYLTRRFHAKIYISEKSALLGSSNLTDGGLRSNREAAIRLDEADDSDSIEELRTLFFELWDSAKVLTPEKLKAFAKVHAQVKRTGPNPDLLIEDAVGQAEPANIRVGSAKKTRQRVFLEQLRREVYEQYRPAFSEVTALLQTNHFRRPELQEVGPAMRVEDYFQSGKRWWIRLHEKGGKRHDVPAHHNAEAYLDAYIVAACIGDRKRSPLFRAIDRYRSITERPIRRTDVLRMIKRRAKNAGLPSSTCCHTFRATGITAYLENGGTIENAQAIAAHESPRTTKLYDRSSDDITLDEVERIAI